MDPLKRTRNVYEEKSSLEEIYSCKPEKTPPHFFQLYAFQGRAEAFCSQEERQKNGGILSSQYPIVYLGKKNLTSFSLVDLKRIQELFEKFIGYNPREKIEAQLKDTLGRCVMRAHMVSLLLDSEGITSFKIFKLWKKSTGYQWDFHVANMIVTSSQKNETKVGQKMIWDPWEGNPEKLFPLESWIIREEEPLPYHVYIADNSSLVPHLNLNGGEEEEASHFRTTFEEESVNAFYRILRDAIPKEDFRRVFARQQEYEKLL